MDWTHINISVKGHGHEEKGLPCQDASCRTMSAGGFHILALADGAGSMKYAREGAEFIVVQACRDFTALLDSVSESELREEEVWKNIAFETFRSLHQQLGEYAHESKLPLNELGSTLIVCAFNENLLLTAHVGDGRAGYRNEHDEWHACMTPWAGEEVSTTVFMNLPVWDDMTYFGSSVVAEPIRAVTLISDGCECLCWNTARVDENKLVHAANEPFKPFYDSIIGNVRKMIASQSLEEIEAMLRKYFHDGHPTFLREKDDKTMMLSFVNETCRNQPESIA